MAPCVTASPAWFVPVMVIDAVPLMLVVGKVPTSPLTVVGPVFVIPEPARTAKLPAVPSGTAVDGRRGAADEHQQQADAEEREPGRRPRSRAGGTAASPTRAWCGSTYEVLPSGVLFIDDQLQPRTGHFRPSSSYRQIPRRLEGEARRAWVMRPSGSAWLPARARRTRSAARARRGSEGAGAASRGRAETSP